MKIYLRWPGDVSVREVAVPAAADEGPPVVVNIAPAQPLAARSLHQHLARGISSQSKLLH